MRKNIINEFVYNYTWENCNCNCNSPWTFAIYAMPVNTPSQDFLISTVNSQLALDTYICFIFSIYISFLWFIIIIGIYIYVKGLWFGRKLITTFAHFALGNYNFAKIINSLGLYLAITVGIIISCSGYVFAFNEISLSGLPHSLEQNVNDILPYHSSLLENSYISKKFFGLHYYPSFFEKQQLIINDTLVSRNLTYKEPYIGKDLSEINQFRSVLHNLDWLNLETGEGEVDSKQFKSGGTRYDTCISQGNSRQMNGDFLPKTTNIININIAAPGTEGKNPSDYVAVETFRNQSAGGLSINTTIATEPSTGKCPENPIDDKQEQAQGATINIHGPSMFGFDRFPKNYKNPND